MKFILGVIAFIIFAILVLSAPFALGAVLWIGGFMFISHLENRNGSPSTETLQPRS